MDDVSEPRSSRLDSIDVLRGLVMVLMALDHARDYFGNLDLTANLRLATAPPIIYFTRWITHLCAPTFVLLAGTGAFLAGRRMSRRQLAVFLLTRGMWLIVLEHTLFHFLWFFQWNPTFLFAQVIWAIGGSMVLLALLVWLPPAVILVLGLAVIAGHNALETAPLDDWGPAGDVIRFFNEFQDVQYVPTDGSILTPFGERVLAAQHLPYELPWHFLVPYPILPWFGVLAFGYGLGAVMQSTGLGRRCALLAIGGAFTAWFITLRMSNAYGDPQPWRTGDDTMRSVMNFLNCEKYPPSLDYVLMTIGPMLILLAVLPDRAPAILRPLVIFGRVPLFFYLMHLLVLHLGQGAVNSIKGISPPFQYLPVTSGPHLGLAWVYVAWLAAIVILYFPCLWYAGVKRRHPGGVLSYL
jgi:uncharacterized membrane protein